MNLRTRSLLGTLVGIALIVMLFAHHARTQNNARPKIATDADFRRAMKELSNWGRWGEKDELGAANLITPVTRSVLFDATLLPGKGTAQGWLEPGTAIHREDLEAL